MACYIIVGAGAFGASTALHLARNNPKAQVHLIDRLVGQVVPTSIDINKVVRTQYPVDIYHELAEEAVEGWQHDDFREFYHQDGWITIQDDDPQSSLLSVSQEILSSKDFRHKFGHIFRTPDCEKYITWDPKVAWVEATQALERTIQLAREAGVQYQANEVDEVCFQDERCIGIRFKSGGTLYGSSVIVAMGPWTKPFIDRHYQLPRLDDCYVNAGVSSAIITLTEQESSPYRGMPILARSAQGEIMPLNKYRQIKITNAKSFTNSELATCGPNEKGDLQSPLLKENRDLLSKYLPQFRDRPFDDVRYCYDFITPKQNFLIDNIPGINGLYVATGGSYHGFKFLPIIGKYVGQMVHGNLRSELREAWAWNNAVKKQQGNVHGDLIPQREFSDKEGRVTSLG